MSGLENVRLHLVETWEDAKDFAAWLESGPLQHGVMGLDTETTGLSLRRDRVRVAQIGDRDSGWTIPCEGYQSWTGLVDDAIARFNGTMFLHNAPFDEGMLGKLGIRLDRSRIRDTMLMAQIREPHLSKALKPQATRHVDKRALAAQQELDEAVNRLGWDGVPIKFGPYWQYAALDPILTCRLAEAHAGQYDQRAFEVESAVQWVLKDMERRGVLTDTVYAREQYDIFIAYCQQLRDWCFENYGVSISSDKSVLRAFQELGYEFTKLTEAGAFSLDKEVLADIDHPLATAVRKHRQVSMLASTYLGFYIQHAEDGFIFPSINTVGARTGRMSMSEPNFQNLPRVSEENRFASVVRNCIVARIAHTLLFCDFSQIETRILAHLSQDPGLLAAFHDPEDFFVVLARRIFSDDTIGKKDARRNIIKTLIYAKIYGAGIPKLSRTLRVPEQQMYAIDDALNAAYPGIKRFQDSIAQEAFRNQRETGQTFVTCPMSGRKHYADRGKEYALVNYLIQGLAAYLFKQKLLELSAAGLDEWMMLPVHDEIILDVPEEKLHYAATVLIQIMNDDTLLSVPVQAEVSYGQRWAEKKDYTNVVASKEVVTT